MSNKQSKKLRQYYKREIEGQFNAMRLIIKDKPWWLPRKFWKIIVKLVLNI